MLTELVREPEPYFRERIKYPTLRTQAVIVAVAGLLANIWRLALYFQLGGAWTYVEDVSIILTLAGIVEFFIAWVVLTAVMHFVANILGGDSNFGRLLRLTGYGFLPLTVAGIIWSAGYYFSLQNASPPEAPLHAGFQFAYERYVDYIGQISGDPVLLGALGVGSIFLLAAGYLWYRGVAVAAGLDGRNAAIAAGLAVAIYLARVFVPVV